MMKTLYKRSIQLIGVGLLLAAVLSFFDGPAIVVMEQIVAWSVVAGILLMVLAPIFAIAILMLKDEFFWWTTSSV